MRKLALVLLLVAVLATVAYLAFFRAPVPPAPLPSPDNSDTGDSAADRAQKQQLLGAIKTYQKKAKVLNSALKDLKAFAEGHVPADQGDDGEFLTAVSTAYMKLDSTVKKGYGYSAGLYKIGDVVSRPDYSASLTTAAADYVARVQNNLIGTADTTVNLFKNIKNTDGVDPKAVSAAVTTNNISDMFDEISKLPVSSEASTLASELDKYVGDWKYQSKKIPSTSQSSCDEKSAANPCDIPSVTYSCSGKDLNYATPPTYDSATCKWTAYKPLDDALAVLSDFTDNQANTLKDVSNAAYEVCSALAAIAQILRLDGTVDCSN